MKQTFYERIGESVYREVLPNGLQVCVVPKPEHAKKYAFFATRYGGMDTRFCLDGKWLDTPAGIAHYLEHKMFESEEGDAFEKYAQTGASANAFTSFDKTCYLFACTDRFQESLEILLDCVTHPYFTKETVEKEQGIIGQEIRMYEDDPGWRVMFNLLQSLYQNNSVKVDIAGSIESIAQIDAELLYRCYHTFYNLHNMVLTIAGNFDPQQVIESADKILKPAEPFCVQRKTEDEPAQVCRKRFVQHLPRFPVRNVRHSTRIDNVNIRSRCKRHDLVPSVFEELLDGFQLICVHFTSKIMQSYRFFHAILLSSSSLLLKITKIPLYLCMFSH